MTLLADLLSTIFERRYRSPISGVQDGRPLEELASTLVDSVAEATGLALAAEILSRFEAMDDGAKLGFFRNLSTEMNINPEIVYSTLEAYERTPSKATYRAFMTAAELARLTTFVTLSPIPGLMKWLNREGLQEDAQSQEQLRSLAAYYLLNAKRSDGLPLDPVAGFHLGNGAIVHAILADADTSKRGRAQSGGVMVNYFYDLSKANQNQEHFTVSREVLTTSAVKALADKIMLPQVAERKTHGKSTL